jgi:hypothetical protein
LQLFSNVQSVVVIFEGFFMGASLFVMLPSVAAHTYTHTHTQIAIRRTQEDYSVERLFLQSLKAIVILKVPPDEPPADFDFNESIF